MCINNLKTPLGQTVIEPNVHSFLTFATLCENHFYSSMWTEFITTCKQITHVCLQIIIKICMFYVLWMSIPLQPLNDVFISICTTMFLIGPRKGGIVALPSCRISEWVWLIDIEHKVNAFLSLIPIFTMISHWGKHNKY